MQKSFRSESKKDYGTNVPEGEGLSLERLNCGSLMRIADATEIMATNYLRLQEDLATAKRGREYYMEEMEKAQRTITAMKGLITKLKKRPPF